MTRGKVRVGGVWIDSVAPASGLTDSTIYRTLGDPASTDELAWSGDYQASCDWAAPPDYSASWLTPGVSTFEVVEGGMVTWAGTLSEATPPTARGDNWSLAANGYGAQGSSYLALSGTTPTYVPNTAIDQANSRGMAFTRASAAIGSSALGVTPEIIPVSTLLSRAALAAGARYWVGSDGVVSLVTPPTDPTWAVHPQTGYLGTPDDSYVSNLYGYFLNSAAGNALAAAPNSDAATSAEAVIQFGRNERGVDLTLLGPMTTAAATTLTDARFGLIGARMGWTNTIDLDESTLLRSGDGAASPLSMCGANGAGTIIRVFGTIDNHSNLSTDMSADITLGQVTRVHDDRRAVATPLGFVWRDFESALAAAQPPEESVMSA